MAEGADTKEAPEGAAAEGAQKDAQKEADASRPNDAEKKAEGKDHRKTHGRSARKMRQEETKQTPEGVDAASLARRLKAARARSAVSVPVAAN